MSLSARLSFSVHSPTEAEIEVYRKDHPRTRVVVFTRKVVIQVVRNKVFTENAIFTQLQMKVGGHPVHTYSRGAGR